jgi:hypothetical protein
MRSMLPTGSDGALTIKLVAVGAVYGALRYFVGDIVILSTNFHHSIMLMC